MCARPASLVSGTAWLGGGAGGPVLARSEHELPYEVYVTYMSFKRNKPDRQIYVWQKDVKNEWTDGSKIRSGRAGRECAWAPRLQSRPDTASFGLTEREESWAVSSGQTQ